MYQAESAKDGSSERQGSSTEHSLLSQALQAKSAAHNAGESMKAKTEADNEGNLQTSTVVRLLTPACTQHSSKLILLRQCPCFMTDQSFKCKACLLQVLGMCYIMATAGDTDDNDCRQGWCATGSTTQSAFRMSVSLDWGLSGTSRAPAETLPAHMWTLWSCQRCSII